MSDLLLLPQPRAVDLHGGTVRMAGDGRIALNVPHAADLVFTANRLREALQAAPGGEWTIAAGDVSASITLSLDTDKPREAYTLLIAPKGVRIAGGSAAGVFYGVCTLIQLLQTHGAELPLVRIDDAPDFPARGVMLDCSRDRVPTMETVYDLIDRLAGWKINEFQLYIEHTFAYSKHETVWEKASPFTSAEMMAIDAYCRERFIDFVPNQNSFGHLHRWFQHERYLPLAETEVGITTPWGTVQEYPFSLSPAAPGALPLLEELFAEFLPNFTSPYFNVGADETFDLGEGKSRALVEEKGKGRVYLDFLLELYQRVKAHGRTMQYWGDIIIHYPALIAELPGDAIALEWGYEGDHDFYHHGALFAGAGIPFYVCPGTSSWTSITGRTDNAMANIRNAAENGLHYGAAGLLNTDWGDLGHWQPLSVSELGFAYGAACAWACEQNKDIDIAAALDAFAFRDGAGVMGRLAYDLGNCYLQPGVHISNGSLLFWLYQVDEASGLDRYHAQLGDGGLMALRTNLQATIDTIDQTMMTLENAAMARADADLVQAEMVLASRLARHGARRGLLLAGEAIDKADLRAELDAIETDFRALWLARSRPGGLDDSARRLHRARALYES